MTILPARVDPCPCGDGGILVETDGITRAFTCEGCREFIAEVLIGPGP